MHNIQHASSDVLGKGLNDRLTFLTFSFPPLGESSLFFDLRCCGQNVLLVLFPSLGQHVNAPPTSHSLPSHAVWACRSPFRLSSLSERLNMYSIQ